MGLTCQEILKVQCATRSFQYVLYGTLTLHHDTYSNKKHKKSNTNFQCVLSNQKSEIAQKLHQSTIQTFRPCHKHGSYLCIKTLCSEIQLPRNTNQGIRVGNHREHPIALLSRFQKKVIDGNKNVVSASSHGTNMVQHLT